MAAYGPKMAWKWPVSTCTKVPLVPGDAWHHAKGFRANWSAILEKTFKMWPKVVKIGPFLANFFLDNPRHWFFHVVSYIIFGLFLYIKINFMHQNWGKTIFSIKMATYGPKMAWKWPLSTCTKVPLVGTLNLCQEMPDIMQKELGQIDQPF